MSLFFVFRQRKATNQFYWRINNKEVIGNKLNLFKKRDASVSLFAFMAFSEKVKVCLVQQIFTFYGYPIIFASLIKKD
ncbi:hypothetical protein PKOR_05885 [Pontibacter korlensis]|uniref:Uncharacterized protein n=1 Tax=Pontibacter korlensis TaxID=400092 RepID=A0A0E3UWJ3_9BACT|nr:hypothetical protein PKOR_05885 [Pontibacter korlensis]